MGLVWKSKYLRILTILLLSQAALFYSVSHGDSKPLKQPLSAFPRVLPGWQMIGEGSVDNDTLNVLKADDLLARYYLNGPLPDLSHLTREQQQAVMSNSEELFIAYFSTQQQGQAPHSPKNCLPGSGWEPVETGTLAIPISGLSAPITVNKYFVAKGEFQSLVLYWYQSHGRVVADEFAAKFYLVADSLRYRRSDTALIRVVTPVIHEQSAAALDSASRFVQAVFPAIYEYMPR